MDIQSWPAKSVYINFMHLMVFHESLHMNCERFSYYSKIFKHFRFDFMNYSNLEFWHHQSLVLAIWSSSSTWESAKLKKLQRTIYYAIRYLWLSFFPKIVNFYRLLIICVTSSITDVGTFLNTPLSSIFDHRHGVNFKRKRDFMQRHI